VPARIFNNQLSGTVRRFLAADRRLFFDNVVDLGSKNETWRERNFYTGNLFFVHDGILPR
jgi:hypothetical protein